MKKSNNKKLLEVNYDIARGEFTQVARKLEAINIASVRRQFSNDIALINDGLDLLYRIMSHYAWLSGLPHLAVLNKANKLVFSTCHKNQIAFYTSLKLTQLGLYGPARAVLRHIYESQLMAKFCSITHNTETFSRWENGDVIYFTNAVLKKIKKPDTEAFREFWGIMSDYSHATVYAQQVNLNVASMPNEITLNFVYIKTLLNCQYHLLISHFITPSMHYYAKRYSRAHEVPALKEKMQSLLKDSKHGLLERPREIIRNYRASWKISEY